MGVLSSVMGYQYCDKTCLLYLSMLNEHIVLILGLVGVCVASFLNVVAYRLPRMMENDWRREAQEFLGLPMEEKLKLSLTLPKSHCPACKAPIAWYRNIPILSWLLQRGRCHHCAAKIPTRYVVVELLGLLSGVMAGVMFGHTLYALVVLGFCLMSLALAVIDAETGLLPDVLVYPFLWTGLALNSIGLLVSPKEAIWGAMAGYLFMWVPAKIFSLLRKTDGMGHGDFKYLAALGAWLGAASLPIVVVLASVYTLLHALLRYYFAKDDIKKPHAFGPGLALAGVLFMLMVF